MAKSICNACGVCCKLFLINLSEEEYKSGKYKTELEECGIIDPFSKAGSVGANILAQKTDGSCIYQKGNLCSIHERRPKVCREFFCTSKNKKFAKMVEMIEERRLDII